MAKMREQLITDDDIDLTDFQPRETSDLNEPTIAQVQAVSKLSHFHSREPNLKPKIEPSPVKRQRRQYRTGRNVQFNMKASQATIDLFYEIADVNGWVLGETLDNALLALQRELEKK